MAFAVGGEPGVPQSFDDGDCLSYRLVHAD